MIFLGTLKIGIYRENGAPVMEEDVIESLNTRDKSYVRWK